MDLSMFSNLVLIIPFALGFLLHWAKKYFVEDGAPAFVQWFFSSVGWTFGAITAGLAACGTLYVASPELFTNPTAATWLSLFTIGWTADSAVNKTK